MRPDYYETRPSQNKSILHIYVGDHLARAVLKSLSRSNDCRCLASESLQHWSPAGVSSGSLRRLSTRLAICSIDLSLGIARTLVACSQSSTSIILSLCRVRSVWPSLSSSSPDSSSLHPFEVSVDQWHVSGQRATLESCCSDDDTFSFACLHPQGYVRDDLPSSPLSGLPLSVMTFSAYVLLLVDIETNNKRSVYESWTTDLFVSLFIKLWFRMKNNNSD